MRTVLSVTVGDIYYISFALIEDFGYIRTVKHLGNRLLGSLSFFSVKFLQSLNKSQKFTNLTVRKFGTNQHGGRIFITFVEDDMQITATEFQLPMSFTVKDIASQTWSEISHFVIN